MWSVDSFAALTIGAVHQVEDLPRDLYDESFVMFNSLVSPWHEWLDPTTYNRHVDTVEALGPQVVASATARCCRGWLSTTPSTGCAPSLANPAWPPGQVVLDELLSGALVA